MKCAEPYYIRRFTVVFMVCFHDLAATYYARLLSYNPAGGAYIAFHVCGPILTYRMALAAVYPSPSVICFAGRLAKSPT